MRPITGADITSFYDGRHDLLVLTPDGEFATIDASDVVDSPYQDHRATSYDYVTLDDGTEVQVMLTRTTIVERDWFPDALGDDGRLAPSVADEMASIINNDGILAGRVQKAREAGAAWKRAADAAEEAARHRAETVAEIVAFCGGNQSRAARLLGLDQSTVNKLVRKAAQR